MRGWRAGLVALLTAAATTLTSTPAMAVDAIDTLWTVDVGGPDSPGIGGDTVIGPDGTTYATGRTDVAAADSAMVTVALSPDGDTLWRAVLDSRLPANDEGVAMALDAAAGRLYVAGIVHSVVADDDQFDWITIAYDTVDGREVWRRYIGGYGSGYLRESPVAVVVDSERDRVYVTGSSTGRCIDPDFVTVAYAASTGVGSWIQRYAGRDGDGCRNSLTDQPTGLALDDAGNVYVTGTSVDNYGKGPLPVISYGFDGKARWFVRQSAGPKSAYRPGRLLVDSARQQLYVATAEGYNLNDPDEALRAYSTLTGRPLWTAFLDSYLTLQRDPGLDPVTGSIIVAGTSIPPANAGAFLVTAVDPDGARLWLRRVTVPEAESAGVDAIRVAASDGTIFLAGGARYPETPSGTPRSAIVVGLSRDGVPRTAVSLPVTEDELTVSAFALGDDGRRLSVVTSYGPFYDELGWSVTALDVPVA